MRAKLQELTLVVTEACAGDSDTPRANILNAFQRWPVEMWAEETRYTALIAREQLANETYLLIMN